jgi:hypothetical protein
MLDRTSGHSLWDLPNTLCVDCADHDPEAGPGPDRVSHFPSRRPGDVRSHHNTRRCVLSSVHCDLTSLAHEFPFPGSVGYKLIRAYALFVGTPPGLPVVYFQDFIKWDNYIHPVILALLTWLGDYLVVSLLQFAYIAKL